VFVTSKVVENSLKRRVIVAFTPEKSSKTVWSVSCESCFQRRTVVVIGTVIVTFGSLLYRL